MEETLGHVHVGRLAGVVEGELYGHRELGALAERLFLPGNDAFPLLNEDGDSYWLGLLKKFNFACLPFMP